MVMTFTMMMNTLTKMTKKESAGSPRLLALDITSQSTPLLQCTNSPLMLYMEDTDIKDIQEDSTIPDTLTLTMRTVMTTMKTMTFMIITMNKLTTVVTTVMTTMTTNTLMKMASMSMMNQITTINTPPMMQY